jgi:hypothetical protein
MTNGVLACGAIPSGFPGPEAVCSMGMCGRFVQIADPLTIQAGVIDLDIDGAAVSSFRPRYNVAPTQDILAVLNTPVPRLTLTRWGLIPSWAKDPSMGTRLINARAETLPRSPPSATPTGSGGASSSPTPSTSGGRGERRRPPISSG